MRMYLKKTRNSKGILQADVVKSLNCGPTSYGMIESGKRQGNMTYTMMKNSQQPSMFPYESSSMPNRRIRQRSKIAHKQQ